MRKIGAFLLLLFVIFSCGKSGNNDKTNKEKGIATKNEQDVMNEIEKKKEEIEKYNRYVEVYNNISNMDGRIIRYFEEAGNEEKVRKVKGSFPVMHVNQSTIDNIKQNLSSKVKMDELDKAAKDMLPYIEELKTLAEAMESYYEGKDFVSDNYAKAQEMHTKFLAAVKKYSETTSAFKKAMEKKDKENQVQAIEEFKKKGEMVRYNLALQMKLNEDFLAEIDNQKLDISNFTNGNVERFKELRDKISKQYEETEKILANEEELKKEGYTNSVAIASFKRKMTEFKGSTASLINRMETKKKGESGEISNSFYAEVSEGTPENVYRVFNEVVREYNNLNR